MTSEQYQQYHSTYDQRLKASESAASDAEEYPSRRARTEHMEGLDLLTHIRNTLPDLVKPNRVSASTSDYPEFDPSGIPNWRWIAADARGREVFRIDDRVYFRRYDENWNSTVVYGSIQGNKVVWHSSLSTDDLRGIAEMI